MSLRILIPKSFQYHSAKNLNEAINLLKRYDDAKILAGGQSLIPMMKLRILSPAHLIDIGKIEDLSYIRKKDNGLMLVGPLTTHSEIEYSDLLKKEVPIMPETASQIADQQVRNLGTIGGSVAHADPAADWPATLLALDASFKITGTGERVVSAKQFFKGPFETDIREGEILTEIQIPLQNGRIGQTYIKFERRAGDFATVGVAAYVEINRDGEIKSARIALSAVAPAAYRVIKAEEILVGKRPSLELVEKAASFAAEQAEPTSDLRGSVEYKKDMARVFTKRALKSALEKAGVVLR